MYATSSTFYYKLLVFSISNLHYALLNPMNNFFTHELDGNMGHINKYELVGYIEM
jgi:hypothetical protein